ncbi:glycosyltransferase [Winogradskyella echinorum]|uniref:Glycosyltransferase n=1 Tax=Winogradskyella echinorum TaxID=538189 RepID=A0ABR6Y2I1_9FLAO|nr:glycosyltransferase [Winogradskyella echinorum]MBC3846938.1 glycosyltransferase [Winogradskyella echinorum]MBC5751286.1 glycosyltransferase [Winogradskyella echinorum]
MSKKKVKFLVVTYTPTIKKDNDYYSYSPYVDEMDVWFRYADEYRILSPNTYPTDFLSKPFKSKSIRYYHIPFIAFNRLGIALKSLLVLPYIIFQLYKAMKWASHIHFRSPGNVTLLGSIVQIFFPSKTKSVKYAGNWDPNSIQPISYRLQQAIFRSTKLSKNIKVLVYGEWPNETKNIIPFMSATYSESEKLDFKERNFDKNLKFVFIGAMVIGKRPLLTVKIIESLITKGVSAELHMFGDGDLINDVKAYVESNNLNNSIFIYGNQPKEAVKKCLLDAHFSILPSKSEGWPKAIAEGMFFGAIPISTKISCLPWILGYGDRGILIESDLENAVETILSEINKGKTYLNTLSKNAQVWSQQYTVNRLEKEIEKITKG